MATGITKRHARACGSRSGRRCNCEVTYQANVWDRWREERVRRTFPTEAAAKTWRHDAVTALRTGPLTVIVEDAPRLAEALDALIRGMEAGAVLNRSGDRYKPGTIRTYNFAVRDMLKPELGHLRLTDVRRRDVQKLIDKMRAEGVSPSRLRNNLDPLRVAFRRAVRDEIVAVSPMDSLELPANRQKPRSVPSPSEVVVLLEALPEEDRALWATAFYAGLRRGELRALRWADVDLAAGVFHVLHGWDDVEGSQAPKSEAGERDVPILPQLRPLLVDLKARTRRDGTALVFGKTASIPFGCETVRRRALAAWGWKLVPNPNATGAKKVWTKGRADALEPVGLHHARHTFTSYLAAAGLPMKDAQTFAGHADVRTTLSIYTHVLDDAHALAAERVGAWLEESSARQLRDSQATI
jgi:integrase